MCVLLHVWVSVSEHMCMGGCVQERMCGCFFVLPLYVAFTYEHIYVRSETKDY